MINRVAWSCGAVAASEVLAAHTGPGREAFIEKARGLVSRRHPWSSRGRVSSTAGAARSLFACRAPVQLPSQSGEVLR